MRVVVKGIYTPLVALTVVRGVNYSVYRGVAHIEVGGGHIYLSSERSRTVGKLAVLHTLEKVKIFLNGSVSVRAVLTRLGQSTSVLSHLLGAQVANVRLAVLYQLDGELIALVKVIRAVEDASVGCSAKPAEVAVDRLNVLHVFLRGVGVVISEVELTAVFFCGFVVYKDRLSRAYMKVSVGLGRETGVYLYVGVFSEVGVDYIVYKIAIYHFFHIVYTFLYSD